MDIKKQSKFKQKEYNNSKRGDWNGVNPITRISKNKKKYDRKADKKRGLKDIDEYNTSKTSYFYF